MESETQIGVMQESNSAQVHQLADYIASSWNTKNCTLPMSDAYSWRRKNLRTSPDMEQQTLSIAHQREQKVRRRLRLHKDTQLDHHKEQWKRQVSQAATYKAEIQTLHGAPNCAGEVRALLSEDANRPAVEQ